MMLEKYQKLKMKKKIIALLSGFALIIFGLVYFIIMPTAKDIKAMSGEVEDNRITLETKYIRGNSLRLLMKNIKEIEPKLSSLDKIFISNNSDLEFITTMEGEASKNQVSQKINLNSPEDKKKNGFQKVVLQLSTGGTFINQLKYLTDLESLNYYINIKSLELTSSPGVGQAAPSVKNGGQEVLVPENQSSNINLSIIADTYWK